MESSAGFCTRCVGSFCLLFSAQAFSVDARVYQLENGGAIAPHLTIELGQDDNPLRGEDGSEASMYVQIEPDVRYILQRRNNKVTFSYLGNYLQYFSEYCSDPTPSSATSGFDNVVARPGDCANSASSTADKASYANHALGVSGFLEISRRARASIDLSTSLNHQALGTGLSANSSVLSALQKPDSRIRNTARAGFSYGANQARGELRLGLSYSDRKFRENAGRKLDNLSESSLEPSATVLYRIGSRTQLLAGISAAEVTGGNSERSIERRIVGVEFDASAITSGSIKLSDVTEDFETRGKLGYTGFDVDLTWRPRRYSTVRIGAGRETERGALNEEVGITTKADIEWVHYWKERISTVVELGIQENKLSAETTADNDANDQTNVVRLEGNYNLRRWLDVGAFVQSDSREGRSVNDESRDYSRTLIGLTANGTF